MDQIHKENGMHLNTLTQKKQLSFKNLQISTKNQF